MKLKLVVATLLSSLIAISAAQARGPYGSINVGNWKGGAYTNDQTGEFTHCAVGAGYDSGIYFMVTIDQGAGWSLGFYNPKWTLANNQAFQIALTFDGQRPFNVQGVALNENLIRVPMPVDSTLIAQFRKAKAMTAFTQGQLFQFKLDQTALLLPALANCVAVVKQQGIANAGDFSVKLAPKAAAAATPAVAAGGSMRVGSPQNLSSEMQIEAIELASNFILKTTLHNPRVLSRTETPIAVASTGAAWQSDEAIGFVRIIPPKDGIKGLDVASAVVAMDAQDCKGKFASGRTSELVDSDLVFRGFSSCDDSGGARISQYFIVSRKKGGFVLFSVVSNMKTEDAKTVAKEERLADFRKAALVVVDH
ncbi:MAG TPA: hypothetical protein VF957_08865 [Bradyrhizobium sp.]